MYTLLVVDDDEIIRQRIARYLKKTFAEVTEVFTAKDGKEGFALYEEKKPDILYTDIAMPRCDGLELVENLHQSGYKPKVVIISAHENFDYARNAIGLGVKHYILKPVLPEKIKEITARLLRELEEQNQFLNNFRALLGAQEENLPTLQRNFLHALLSREQSETQIREQARLVEIDLTGACYMMAILRITPSLQEARTPSAIRELCSFCRTAVGALSPATIRFHAIPFGERDVVLLAISEAEEDASLFEQAHTFLDQVISTAEKHLGFAVIASFGGCCKTVSGIADSYREAAEVLQSAEGAAACPEPAAPQPRYPVTADRELETKLIHGVKYKPFAHVWELAEALLATIKTSQGIHCDSLRNYLLGLAAVMAREFEGVEQDQDQEHLEADYAALLTAACPEDCAAWLQAFLQQLTGLYTQLSSSVGNPIVNRAKHIMHSQMSDSALSIDMVASDLYVSSNYLRYLFTQHSPESFVEHLTRIRMEHSLAMLQSSNLKVQEIARLSGYSNQRYFSSCFKKYYGKTPSEIRDE